MDQGFDIPFEDLTIICVMTFVESLSGVLIVVNPIGALFFGGSRGRPIFLIHFIQDDQNLLVHWCKSHRPFCWDVTPSGDACRLHGYFYVGAAQASSLCELPSWTPFEHSFHSS